jgi:hypothetical protein
VLAVRRFPCERVVGLGRCVESAQVLDHEREPGNGMGTRARFVLISREAEAV